MPGDCLPGMTIGVCLESCSGYFKRLVIQLLFGRVSVSAWTISLEKGFYEYIYVSRVNCSNRSRGNIFPSDVLFVLPSGASEETTAITFVRRFAVETLRPVALVVKQVIFLVLVHRLVP